jgi:hypothetical protein
MTALHEGYLLLQPARSGYRGVDRHPFDADGFAFEGNNVSVAAGDAISAIVAQHAVPLSDFPHERFLLRTAEAADRIQRLLAHEGCTYEVVRTHLRDKCISPAKLSPEFWGIDIAYPGGDFYSAVKNGLYHNGNVELIRQYGSATNEFGLFATCAIASDFLDSFRQCVPSESASKFWYYELYAR